MELTNNEWKNLFQEYEQQSTKTAVTMNEKYIYLGEIDCPDEMLSDIHVKLSDIQGIGKINWLKSVTTGKYIHVGDGTLDNLFSSGKIIEHDYECESFDPEYEKYSLLSKEEQIAYRIKNQGVSNQLAKQLVYYEFGYSFDYVFEYKVTEISCDTSDNSKEENTYNLTVEADTLEEANIELSSNIRKEGETICTFTKFPKGYNPSIGEMMTGGKFQRYKKYVVSVIIELVNQTKN